MRKLPISMFSLNLLYSIVLIATFGTSRAVHAQWSSSIVAAQLRHVMPQTRNPRSSIYLEVEAASLVEEALIEKYRRVARLLTDAEMPPPDVRIRHHLEINGEFSSPVIGWNGTVTNVEELPGGLLVTLRVGAKYDYLIDSHHIFERYLIAHDGITFIGATWPPQPSRVLLGP